MPDHLTTLHLATRAAPAIGRARPVQDRGERVHGSLEGHRTQGRGQNLQYLPAKSGFGCLFCFGCFRCFFCFCCFSCFCCFFCLFCFCCLFCFACPDLHCAGVGRSNCPMNKSTGFGFASAPDSLLGLKLLLPENSLCSISPASQKGVQKKPGIDERG